jgi:hypothetical protein
LRTALPMAAMVLQITMHAAPIAFPRLCVAPDSRSPIPLPSPALLFDSYASEEDINARR